MDNHISLTNRIYQLSFIIDDSGRVLSNLCGGDTEEEARKVFFQLAARYVTSDKSISRSYTPDKRVPIVAEGDKANDDHSVRG